jgi:hypothetical protein
MEQSQLETIYTICQNIQLSASILQEYVSQKKIFVREYVISLTG